MILGNLYREKGQVGRAITIHQAAAAAARSSRGSSTPTSCCAWASTTSAADSSIGRSRRSARCCASSRRTRTPWSNLQKLHEEQHQWQQAREVRAAAGRHQRRGGPAAQPPDPRVHRERAGPRRRSSRPTRRRPRPTSRPRSTSTRATCRRTSTWATSGWPRAGRRRRPQAWERVTRGGARAGVPRVRPPRVAVPVAEVAGPVPGALPPAHPGEPEGLARAPGAGPQHHGGTGARRTPSNCSSRRSRTAPTP